MFLWNEKGISGQMFLLYTASLSPEIRVLLPPPAPSGSEQRELKPLLSSRTGLKSLHPGESSLFATALLSFPAWRQHSELSRGGGWKIQIKMAMPILDFYSVLLNRSMKGQCVVQQNESRLPTEAGTFEITDFRNSSRLFFHKTG